MTRDILLDLLVAWIVFFFGEGNGEVNGEDNNDDDVSLMIEFLWIGLVTALARILALLMCLTGDDADSDGDGDDDDDEGDELQWELVDNFDVELLDGGHSSFSISSSNEISPSNSIKSFWDSSFLYW